MTRYRSLIVGATIVVVVMAASLVSGGATPTTRLPTQAGCAPSLAVRPATITLACADDNAYYGQISWTYWSAAAASGAGEFYLNSCTPSCAADKVTRRSRVSLEATRPLTRDGVTYFSELVVVEDSTGRVIVMHWQGSPTGHPSSWSGGFFSS